MKTIRFGIVALAAAALVATASGYGTSAGANTPSSITYAFDEQVTAPSIHGSGHSSDGVVDVALSSSTGDFTAQVNRPAITIYGAALGLIPITAVASFEQVGTFAGKVDSSNTLAADLTIDIHVNSISLLGLLPVPVSDTCHTITPSKLHLTSAPGGFSIAAGGTVTSTFSVGKLTGCGLTTDLLNNVVPGSGNQVTLKLIPVA